MNPFFWLLVALSCVCLWFLLRGFFVSVGTAANDLIQDTKNILNSDEEDELNGGNENA